MDERAWRLQSMGSLWVGHDWTTSLSLFTFIHCRRKWQPPPVFLPGESQGWGAWWAAVYGVAQSRTWLKRLSSSSSSFVAAANVKTWNWHIGMKSYLPVPLWKDRQVAGVQVWFQSGARKHLRWLERPGFESYFCSSFRILWVSFTHSIALYLLTWSKLNICTLWVDVED